jgi:Putative lumazine-binding
VDRLERATAARDFATVCDEVLTAAARRRSGGADCARLLRSVAEGVRRPSIEIRGIKLEGRRAQVKVRTRAEGQQTVSDVLELRRQDGEWRVEALAH